VSGSSPESHRRPSPRLDTGVPHSARVWNYLLGGTDNFAADREICDVLMQMFPGIIQIAREQRRFLLRSVRYLSGEAGIRQFLHIGAGLPVGAGTHQVAQAVAPESRVVYVDADPLVLVRAQALLASAPGGVISYIEADVRDTEEIVHEAARTLSLSRPIAVMMLGVAGQVPDSALPGAVVSRLLGALPPGSYLALSDGTDTSPGLNQAVAVYNQFSANPYHLRSPGQIARFFCGLSLVPPGVVTPPQWRPEIADASIKAREVNALCGVGRKD
jgi:S-adenosyl methyltransferase